MGCMEREREKEEGGLEKALTHFLSREKTKMLHLEAAFSNLSSRSNISKAVIMSNETEATIAEAPVAVAQIAESAAAASTSASNEASTSAPAPPESNTSSAPAPLSKNAQKRLLKAQAAAAIKLERRAKEREKKKEKRQRIREEHDPEEAKKLLKRKKAPEPKDQTPFASEVCVDLGWDDLMSDRVSSAA